MSTDGFTAEIAERTVVVTLPDNGMWQLAEGWDRRAQDSYPTLYEIEGPLINGCIALHWQYDDATDAELLARSLNVVRSETPAGGEDR